jgi:LacI family transcriptional regulator
MKRVALILENITWSFDSLLADALGQACAAQGSQLIIYEARYGNLALAHQKLHIHEVDSVIFMADSISLAETMASMKQFVLNCPVPLVTIGLRFPGTPCVTTDNHKGMALLMTHLLAQGARRIAHVTGPSMNREASARKRAYLESMIAAGITPKSHWIVEGIFSSISGYNSTLTLLPHIRSGEIDALVFANDEAAAGSLRLLEAEGIGVPHSLLVAGYGDTPLALMTDPPLTTVSNNPHAMAEAALALLHPSGQPDAEAPTVEIEPVLRPSASTRAERRVSARRELLHQFPLTYLHQPEFFSDTRNPEVFWREMAEKLREYLIGAFFVVRIDTREQPVEPDSPPRFQGTLLFGFCDNDVIYPTQSVVSPALLPEGMLYRYRGALVYKAILFADKPFGYILTSPNGANTQYLEDLCRHCMAWLEADHHSREQLQFEQRMTDTVTQLSLTNRQLNELRIRNNLDGTATFVPDPSGCPDAPMLPFRGLATPAPQTHYLILVLDIDGLRQINTRFGYDEGDHVLEVVESALKRCVRDQDRVLRQGSDSFLLLVKQSGPDMVDALQQRLLGQLDELNAHMEKGYRIDFTWGYAHGTSRDTFGTVIRKADEMLIRKKKERMQAARDY